MLSLDSARLLVQLVEAYAGLGCLVAVAAFFVFAPRLDRQLATSPIGVRLVLLAGGVLLWPLIVVRLIRGTGQLPVERNAHRGAEAP